MNDETLIELVNRLLSLEDLKQKNDSFGEKLYRENRDLKVEIGIVLAKIKEKIKND